MYGKLFDTIFDSSIMEESIPTRLLWDCLIILADEEGVVDMTIPALSRRTNIPVELVEDGVSRLCAPDPSSRTPAESGRRLLPLDGQPFGWRLVNFAHYRALRTSSERNEYFREYRRKKRAEARGESGGCSREQSEQSVNTSPTVSVSVSAFEEFWKAYPKKVGKRDAAKAWEQTKAERPPLADLLATLTSLSASRQWCKDGGQFAPYPATWLRRGGWDDVPENGGARGTQTTSPTAVSDLRAKSRFHDPEAPDA